MEKIDIELEVVKLKAEAVRLLDGLFQIPDGFSSGQTERIVSCIVSAAILEIAGLNAKIREGK